MTVVERKVSGIELRSPLSALEQSPEAYPHRVASVAKRMELVLGIAPAHAAELARCWWHRVLEQRVYWQEAVGADRDYAETAIASLTGSCIRSAGEVLNDHPGGVVLTTLHMGNYLLALAGIARELAGREIVIVRRSLPEDDDEPVFDTLRNLGIAYRVVSSAGEQSAQSLALALRGGAVAVAFFDLGSEFGSTGEVTFLGSPCYWVKGPAVLARRTRSLLVPFAAVSDAVSGSTCVDLETAIDFGGSADQRPSVPATMQWLASYAEALIQRYPDQWLHWSHLDAMRRPD